MASWMHTNNVNNDAINFTAIVIFTIVVVIIIIVTKRRLSKEFPKSVFNTNWIIVIKPSNLFNAEIYKNK